MAKSKTKSKAKSADNDRVSEAAKKVADASQQAKSTSGVQTPTAFTIFFASHLVAAIYSPIQDCDEVFNYWEPTHYLNHGHGFQTWEYSPEYAIRSWAYTGIHALTIKIGSILPFVGTKVAEFYLLRVVLGLACAACEARLFTVVQRTMSARIALIFMIIMATSTGMFHASVAYLPSSFAMYCAMLGYAAFMDWRGALRTAQGIFWFGLGGILGWPFASALVLPFILEEGLTAAMTGDITDTFLRFLDGSVRSLILLAVEFGIDTFFYRKYSPVPLNIVLYNVFSGAGKGPNIYGTEPWHFYARNLFLNFHVWLLFALSSLPLLLMQHFGFRQSVSKQSLVRTFFLLMPFYMWIGIMTIQPHKEERFMYPVYPALALNAAVAVHVILTHLGHPGAGSALWRIPSSIKFLTVFGVAAGAITLSILRTAGIVAYNAPLSVYAQLNQQNLTQPGDVVCVGKEWYRFPSSYFLPDGVRAKFVKSEFSGLLPGEFSEARQGFGFFPGAHLIPPGMNDENIEDPGKYIDIEHCTFLVDVELASTQPTELEPSYFQDYINWEPVYCERFLDSVETSFIGRLLWVPDWRIIPTRFRRTFGDYCLLRQLRPAPPSHDQSGINRDSNPSVGFATM